MKSLLTKKIANQIVSFNSCQNWENIILPLHMVNSTCFFEGLIEVLFKLWHLDMIDFFNVINLAPKFLNLYHWLAGKSKLNSVSTTIKK